MRVQAFGGGTDSAASLCGWVEKGLQHTQPIDLILFADTGGEQPHTYDFINTMNEWLPQHGLPQIITVKKAGRKYFGETLEENCLRLNMLPSIAYGRKACSHKYKIQPQDMFLNRHPATKAFWRSGGKVEKLIGYEFAEVRRWAKAKLEDDKYVYRFPLVEWEWSRPECVAAIKRMGLPQPGKSSCFFCPSMKRKEIEALKTTYPVLFHRAIAMEDGAQGNLTKVKGLGRSFAWREHVDATVTEGVESGISVCLSCSDGSAP